MREIPLTKGYVALVDDEDYAKVVAAGPWGPWHASEERRQDGTIRNVYVRRNIRQPDGLWKGGQTLHRFLMEVNDPKILVDHHNQVGLDCQRHNLRIATGVQTLANSRKRKHTSSDFKGVSRFKDRRKWGSYIRINGKLTHLGFYSNPIVAALRYDRAAHEHFGDFAKVNFNSMTELFAAAATVGGN